MGCAHGHLCSPPRHPLLTEDLLPRARSRYRHAKSVKLTSNESGCFLYGMRIQCLENQDASCRLSGPTQMRHMFTRQSLLLPGPGIREQGPGLSRYDLRLEGARKDFVQSVCPCASSLLSPLVASSPGRTPHNSSFTKSRHGRAAATCDGSLMGRF